MSNRNSDSTGHKSDVGNRTSIGNSSQRQQPAKTGPSTTSSTSPANRNTTSTAPKATKPSFSAAAGGKPPAHVPVRTNSAPPEEHPGDAPKSHFVPTKTTSQMTGVTSEHSYRSALGVKTESNDQKPKAAPEQPQEKVQPQPEPQPEKVATSQPPAQPEVTTPVINDTTGQAISNDPSATVSAENLEKSPQFNRDGDQREYRNSTRGTRDPNTQRRTDRSGSWGGNGSMGNNRAPRNNQANTQPQQQQQQQQQQLQQQQYVAYQQQPTQYTPQQMYYLQQQQQQTQQFYAQYGSLLTLPQQQFQAYLVQYFTPDQHSFWWQHWQAYQTLRQQQQQYYMYYGQAYQQVPQYYQAGGVAVQGYPYAYSASQMPATTANVAYTNVPSTGKYPEDNTPQVAPPVATNPVVQSSPVVNTTPVVTTSTPSQTPVVAAKPEPEVPPPAIDIPPTQEEVKPKIEIPTKRKGPVIKTKEGVEVDLSKLKSAPVPKPSQPVAEQATESQEKADSDKPTEVQVTEESAKVEEIKVETAPIASTPSVEQVIPDLPVEVARPKKARAPTIDEPSPVKEIDQPSFPVEKPVKEEASLAPPGLKKEVQAENWEEADTSAQGPAPVADQPGLGRRLVQGNKLSHAHGKLAQPVSKKVYTKQEIFALRPDGEFNRSLLGSINYVADGGASSGHGKGGGNYPRGGRGGVSGGREGREGRGGNYGGDLTPTSTGEAPGWTREALPPLQTGGHGGKKGKQPASPVPPPKKKELDPIEVLANEAMLILNQIAPKTFDLFCQKLLDLSLKNTAMLDKVVELIFEKAIYDTAFVEMYAELCLQLKERSAWTFFTIVKVEEGEFFWIRDFTFPEEAAGPYYSRQDALNVFNPSVTAEIPVMKPSSISPSNIKQQEILLSKTHFLKIVQKNEGEWFVTYVPESAVPVEQRSQSLFTSDKEASKDAVTELSFRGRLAHSCEIEFQKSVKDESLFEAVDEEYKQLRAKRATISQDEYEIQEADILERRTKIKRRMLANIRFVGELYKKKLLNTETMHDCIVELLGHPPNWKQSYDEEDLELLCDLLSTVGETLETKTKKLKNKEKSDYVKKFDQYFEKLKLLSKDRNLISRIRFRIEAVVDLRSNNWVKRTGPITTAPAEPAQKEDRPVSQRGAPSASSSSNAPRILSRQEGPSGGDRYGGNSGRPSSQRDPYERDNRGGREDNRGSGRYGAPAGGSYDERDYNRGGGRGGGDDRRYRSNEPPARQAAPPSSAGSGKFAPPSTTAVPTEEAVDKLQFDSESKVRKGVESSVDEVLSGIEVGELTATLKESSFLHTGFFIQILLDKYSNSSSAKARDTLLAILDDGELSSWLVTNRLVVEKAVEQYAPLLQLVDTSVDILQAPELLGTVVGRLVKGNAINRGAIEKMVGIWTQFNIDDMGCPPEDVEKVFNRFLSKLL